MSARHLIQFIFIQCLQKTLITIPSNVCRDGRSVKPNQSSKQQRCQFTSSPSRTTIQFIQTSRKTFNNRFIQRLRKMSKNHLQIMSTKDVDSIHHQRQQRRLIQFIINVCNRRSNQFKIHLSNVYERRSKINSSKVCKTINLQITSTQDVQAKPNQFS